MDNNHNDFMIDNDNGFCVIQRPALCAHVSLAAEPTDRESRRGKRSPKYPAKNTCPLLLVADYRFFRNMGQGSVSKTAIYLV